MNKLTVKQILKDIAIILIMAIFFIGDRLLKAVSFNLDPGSKISIISNFFVFSFTKNYNIAFSLPLSGPVLNIIIISLILVIIFIILRLENKAKKMTSEAWILTIILFGAISNIADRLIYGFVIDYLELRYFTAFNLADAMISLGALTLIIKNFNPLLYVQKKL